MPAHRELLYRPQYIDTLHVSSPLRAVMMMVWRHMHRCKYLAIMADNSIDIACVLEEYFNIAPGAPVLHRLSISNVGYLIVEDDEVIVNHLNWWELFCNSAPVLTHVRFNGVPLLTSLLSPPNILTSLSLVRVEGPGFDWSALRSILRSATALCHMTVWDMPFMPVSPPSGREETPFLELPSLVYLAVGRVPLACAVMLFQVLHITQLKTLVLEFISEDCEMLGVYLAGLGANSARSSVLQTVLDFDVTGFRVSVETGAAIWRELVSLESLYICDCREFFRGFMSGIVVAFPEEQGRLSVPIVANLSLVSYISPLLLDVAAFVFWRAQVRRPIDILHLSYFFWGDDNLRILEEDIRKFVGELRTANHLHERDIAEDD